MQALCIPPERRVFKLCYLCELMAVVSGLVMFLSAYLLRFDATSTFGVVGAFFANVSLLFNLTGILNCLCMGMKLSAGKGSVHEALDVLQGLGQTFMIVIFGANGAGMAYMFLPSTSRSMTRCVGPTLDSSSRRSVTRIISSFGTLCRTSP